MAAVRTGYDALARLCTRSGLHRPTVTNRNAVLMYHSVRDPEHVRPETGDITVGELRRHLEYYTSNFEVVDLPRVREHGGRGPDAKRVALTFDDGYRDFYTNVRPVLHEFDVPATAFVVPSFLDGENRRERVMNAGHLYDVLTTEQVRELVDDPLVTIGNHSLTHHDLGAHHERDIIEEEVRGGKRELEERFGVTVDRFSYPNGAFNRTSLDVVRDSHAVATLDESMRPLLGSEDPMLVPRIDGGLPFEQVKWRLSDANGELMRLARRGFDGLR